MVRKTRGVSCVIQNNGTSMDSVLRITFSVRKTDKKEGYIPAAVVRQYYDLFSDQPLHLIIGGYRNKQAAILQRRHELYSVPAGWNEDLRDRITEVVNIGLDCENFWSIKLYIRLLKAIKIMGSKVSVLQSIQKHRYCIFILQSSSFITCFAIQACGNLFRQNGFY